MIASRSWPRSAAHGDPARRLGNEYLYQMLAEAERRDAQEVRVREGHHHTARTASTPSRTSTRSSAATSRSSTTPSSSPSSSRRPAEADQDASDQTRHLPRLLLPRPLQRRLRGAAQRLAPCPALEAHRDAPQPRARACAAAAAAAQMWMEDPRQEARQCHPGRGGARVQARRGRCGLSPSALPWSILGERLREPKRRSR